MATNLGLDNKISAIENLSSTSTRLRALLQDFIRSAFHSTANPFGSAALKDASKNKPNTVALTGDDGKLSIDIIPEINEEISSTFDNDRIPGLHVDKITSGELSSSNLASGGRSGEVLTKTGIGQEWGSNEDFALFFPDSKALPTTYFEGGIVIAINKNPVAANQIGGAFIYKNNSWQRL